MEDFCAAANWAFALITCAAITICYALNILCRSNSSLRSLQVGLLGKSGEVIILLSREQSRRDGQVVWVSVRWSYMSRNCHNCVGMRTMVRTPSPPSRVTSNIASDISRVTPFLPNVSTASLSYMAPACAFGAMKSAETGFSCHDIVHREIVQAFQRHAAVRRPLMYLLA